MDVFMHVNLLIFDAMLCIPFNPIQNRDLLSCVKKNIAFYDNLHTVHIQMCIPAKRFEFQIISKERVSIIMYIIT